MNETAMRARLEGERARLTELRSAADRLTIGTPEEEQPSTGRPDGPPSESVGVAMERELDQTILDQAELDLAEVASALERIDAGTYGVCEGCGKPIGEARLEARPFARLCIEDQTLAERNR